MTAHLAQFGAREVPRGDYRLLLDAAAAVPAAWIEAPEPDALEAAILALGGR